MSYTSIRKKIKPMRGRAFNLGGLVPSDSELTTADSANQRGIDTRAMVRRPPITTYAPKEDFFTKFIKAQDERFSKMKEYKIARHLPLDDPEKYNPEDSNGTKLSDYDKKFGDNK